jgi:Predicted nucleic acid-binding protein, contains PIN domain
MDVCIDTNVFSNLDFLQWVADNKINVYLPSIAYMESAYHQSKTYGGSLASFISMLAGLRVTIVPFDSELALIAAKNASVKRDLKENAMDHAIGAYAYRRKIPMITNNKKHFTSLKEVYTPDEFMKKYRK